MTKASKKATAPPGKKGCGATRGMDREKKKTGSREQKTGGEQACKPVETTDVVQGEKPTKR